MRTSSWLLVAAGLSLWACEPSVVLDDDEIEGRLPERDGPTVELDPGAGVLPFPYDGLRDPASGRVRLAAGCGEPEVVRSVREGDVAQLDGFGASAPAIRVVTSDAVDPGSLADRVVLVRDTGDGTYEAVPVTAVVDLAPADAGGCSRPELANHIRITPQAPLTGRATYVVALAEGITTAGGEPMLPTVGFALLRGGAPARSNAAGEIIANATDLDPIADRTALLRLEALWRLHAPGVALGARALGVSPDEVLAAWPFTVQTLQEPLNPASPGSPAAAVASAAPTDLVTQLEGSSADFLQDALGLDAAACALRGCGAVGDVLSGTLRSRDHQTNGDPGVEGARRGAWDDPASPTLQNEVDLPLLLIVPAAAPPPEGYPLVVFGHDLGGAARDALAVAPELAAAGFAVAAIDWVHHGARAVRVSSDAQHLGPSGAGCDGPRALLDPAGAHAHCFAPFIDLDLAASRDRLRQSALDLLALVRSLSACTGAACDGVHLDASRVVLWGLGLGAGVGALTAAAGVDLRAAVLTAAGGGLVELIETSADAAWRCGLVDGLVAAGAVGGAPFDPATGDGACTESGWRVAPAWTALRPLARWIFDAADPVPFARRLRGAPVLLQQITADAMVPNGATTALASALGLAEPDLADPALELPLAPSRAVAPGNAPPATPRWLRYTGAPAAAGHSGTTYTHDSVLAKPTGGCHDPVVCEDGELGSARLRLDAVTFLREAVR